MTRIDAITAMNSLDTASAPGAGMRASGGGGSLDPSAASSWFEALARAWGSALDQQAERVTQLSSVVGEGSSDQPSAMIQLTAESLRLQFLSNNASTSTNSVGQALETLGRKQ